jgi:hypothetical protein
LKMLVVARKQANLRPAGWPFSIRPSPEFTKKQIGDNYWNWPLVKMQGQLAGSTTTTASL